MISPFSIAYNSIIHAGTESVATEREKRGIRVINRAWLILFLVQSASLLSHLVNHIHRSAMLTIVYMLGLGIVHWFMRRGKINTAKMLAIGVINYNTIIMAVFLGEHTHIIDFLLLSAILPFYLFEIKNRRLIFWGTALSVAPFAVFQYIVPELGAYSLPLSEQLSLYNTTRWMLVVCLAALLYLIYQKNVLYESDVLESEAQLMEQKRMYERILEQIPIDIVTFDKDLRYTYINSTAIKDPVIRKWLIGKSNVEYFKERGLDMDTAAERERILRDALQKESKIETEETFIDRHGQVKHSIKGAMPLYSDDHSELLCVIGYSLDITDIREADRKQKEYAAELERRNEELNHFVNATSHDLKSPLRNIASHLQLLERKNKGKLDEDSISLIDHTVKSVKHLNQLINDIYQYSVADRNDNPDEVTDLNQVFIQTIAQISEVIQERHVQITCAKLPVLKMASSHISMIFSNLLGNAIKYNSSETPVIEVGCHNSAGQYIIYVKDNGIGISQQYSRQIFEIFKRLHTSEVYEGTGVGLAICKKIVETYGGRIWVKSDAGKGSTFYFSLNKMMVDQDSSKKISLQPYEQMAKTG
ncbi:MAG: ATP-binding protein [Chitinophagales bacterium]